MFTYLITCNLWEILYNLNIYKGEKIMKNLTKLAKRGGVIA